MKKPTKYYVYYSYKDDKYHLFNRDTFDDYKFSTFKKLYNFVLNNDIDFNNLRLKSMTVLEFLDCYAQFTD